MQTDARFIEDIKHSSQAGPDLSGEPDPLRFAATECAALAIEREIAQPDLEQELQTRFNFTHHFRRDLLLLGRDRKSTRLNSSHSQISYAVFCLKKKKIIKLKRSKQRNRQQKH